MNSLHALGRELEIGVIHLRADISAIGKKSCCTGAAAACKWIENGLALKSETTDQLRECLDWFLRRMKFVTAVGHIHHITERLLRKWRTAFRE